VTAPYEQVAVGALRAQIERLPDEAQILVEARDGSQYDVRRVRAIGTATDDPGLVITVERVR
jgi:hypothetical protein